jgi:hypothetical protein
MKIKTRFLLGKLNSLVKNQNQTLNITTLSSERVEPSLKRAVLSANFSNYDFNEITVSLEKSIRLDMQLERQKQLL